MPPIEQFVGVGVKAMTGRIRDVRLHDRGTRHAVVNNRPLKHEIRSPTPTAAVAVETNALHASAQARHVRIEIMAEGCCDAEANSLWGAAFRAVRSGVALLDQR